MKRIRYFYLVELQYLGFRYSGWQKQPGFKTIEGMLSKTLRFVLLNTKFKIIGSGRTDAKVSALQAACELFIEDEPLHDLKEFVKLFNENLPPDIKVIRISEVDDKFNIIQHPKEKEYIYLFSHGDKNHPFCAPFLANIVQELNIPLMQQAAKLFEGTHNFKAYTSRPRPNSQFVRTINTCILKENAVVSASFFPNQSYALHVTGSGFMRYQIRMIMGALIQLGKGELTMETLKDSLMDDSSVQLNYVAPGSGLLLHRINFDTTS